jgi:hypothetical protein
MLNKYMFLLISTLITLVPNNSIHVFDVQLRIGDCKYNEYSQVTWIEHCWKMMRNRSHCLLRHGLISSVFLSPLFPRPSTCGVCTLRSYPASILRCGATYPATFMSSFIGRSTDLKGAQQLSKLQAGLPCLSTFAQPDRWLEEQPHLQFLFLCHMLVVVKIEMCYIIIIHEVKGDGQLELVTDDFGTCIYRCGLKRKQALFLPSFLWLCSYVLWSATMFLPSCF